MKLAFFNKPQRRRGRGGKQKAIAWWSLGGDRFLTNYRGRRVEFVPFLNAKKHKG
ncbi:hypothetical protein JYQ62_31610 [Nostoc sp. UHCC 0702]|nr:hypothetical protein JYQ62_31610 [Nostoc sp. UHCC 0702]